jgi:hypothetical protein
VCAASANVAVSTAWTEYTGYFKGVGTASTTPSTDPAAPRQLHSNVRYIRPHIILGFSAGGDTYELDYVAIDIIPETLDHIPNGSNRKCVTAIDASGKAMIDFTQSHTGKGALATKSSVDLATGDVTNKSADNIAEGATRKWAGETGATVGARLGTNLKKADNVTIVTDDDLFLNGLWARTITLSGVSAKFRTATSGARIEITTEEITGYSDNTTKQFFLKASDGKAYAGGGEVWLDATGLNLKVSAGFFDDSPNDVKWKSGGNTYTKIYCIHDTTNLRISSGMVSGNIANRDAELNLYTIASGANSATTLLLAQGATWFASLKCFANASTAYIESDSDFIPALDDFVNLGRPAFRWWNGYFSGDLMVAGNVRRQDNVGSLTLYGGTNIYNGGGILVNAVSHPTNPGNTYICFGGAASTGACYIRHWNGSAWNISFSTDYRGNVTVGSASFANNGQNCLMVATGIVPTTQVADHFAIYSADQVAGNACPHFRTENGSVIKLFAGAALTTNLSNILHLAAGTDTNQMGGGTASGWGFASQDGFRSFMARFLNVQQRVNQLEARLQGHGLLA